MPPISYLQSILCYFCIMDIDLLRHYLKDKYTYQETTKEVFLDKIESIFEKNRNAGDTELWLFPGACAGKECENCGKRGYRFVGNHSKNYIDLLFEVKDDDITDIYSCLQFNSDTEIHDLGKKESIFFDLDDKAHFTKSPEYWAQVYAATNAYALLVTKPPRKLTFEELKYWLDKHASLYKQLEGFSFIKPGMKWTPFLRLYYDLEELGSIVSENLDQIRQANQILKTVEAEPELIDWLLRYEEIHNKGTIDLMFTVVKDGEDYYFDKVNPYLFKGEIFNEVFGFFESYQIHHEELLEKYSIYTLKDESKICNEENFREEKPDICSLRFHLEQRKELAEMGIQIPLYLRKGNEQTEESNAPF